MLHEIKLYFTEVDMQKLVLSVFLILFLIPFPQGFSAGETNTPSTLSVNLPLNTQSVFLDSDGYATAIGLVENNNSLASITNIQLQVRFFSEFNPEPIETILGSTTLDVIPPNGKSTFAIRSENPNPDITEVSVSLLGFTPSVPKQKGLVVYSNEVFLDTSFRFSGVLQNGGAPSADTKVHLAFYDNFDPPQILGVSTIELGNMFLNSEIAFEIDEQINSRAVGFLLFAESSVFHSDFVDVKIPLSQVATKLVTISDVSVEDTMGNKLSELKVDSIVNVKSKIWIQFAADQESNETAYTYYVQIKESGQPPYVEFIGKSDGRFIGTGPESQTIDWIPEKKGLFFIETFVWDRNNIPIAEQGPIALIIVN